MRSLGVLLACAAMATAQLQTVEMRVSGLDCASCAESVGKRLGRIRGVESATFDASANAATIKLLKDNRVTLTAIRDALKSLGYTPGDATVQVRGEVEKQGSETFLSLPHQPRAFLLEGIAASGSTTVAGSVPAPSQGKPDRLKPSQTDVVYFNGKIITVAKDGGVAEAFAIRGNRFTAVGSSKEVLAGAGPSTVKIDLQKRAVVPGLIDSHVHPVSAALVEQDAPIPTMGSISDIQDYIRKQAASLPADRVIFVPKIYPSRLKERRYPTRYDIDAASGQRAAMCDNGYAAVINSVLLQRAGIDRNTPQPPNGKIIKDEKGEPTGLILGAPQLLSKFRQNRPITHADRVWALKAMQKAYNKVGLTSVFDRSQGPDGFRAYQDIHRDKQMTVRTNVTYYLTTSGTPQEVEADIRRIPFVTGWGDEWLRVGPLKTTVDGGILIGTAYMREPWGPNTQIYGYTDPDYRGVLAVKKENLFTMARVANELGWQMTSHATGGAALDLLLEAYEAADKEKSINGRRFNVMHANFPNAAAIERAKKLGVVFDSQIAWYHADADALNTVFGPERMKIFLPFKSLVDAGLTVVGGSDHMIRFHPKESINPYDPFYGMWMAITRKTTAGAVFNPELRVSREDALRMWTINGAYNSFEEDRKGSIEPGKLADFVVISKDYLTCPVDEIKDIQALRTVVDGKVVYEDASFAKR